jgi:nicotinamidase-related amidase
MNKTQFPSALIVIDVQESFRQRHYWPSFGDARGQAEVTQYIENQNKLIEAALAQKLPIIRVLHQDAPDVHSNPFSMSSGFVKPMEGLAPFEASATFVKHVHSAAVGTNLLPWLKTNGIHKVIISGIRTEQCCETTTRHLSDEGFQVDYVLEATLTFDMKTRSGRTLSAQQIRERTATVLEDRFARICTVEQAVAG